MSPVPDEKPPRVAFGMYKRFALAGVLITLLTAGAVASAGLLEVKDLVTVIKEESAGHVIPGLRGALDDVPAGKPQTILVLGSDRRFVDIKQDNPARSDTMMLVRLDPSKEATAVMNIPRDLKVPIQVPGGGIDTTKINAAYSYGGPALAVKTVRNLLHIPINHVVNVNFGGFQRAVNRLGCVYVDVDRRYYHSNAGLPASAQYAEINVPAGYQKLCGSKSLDYVRFRHADDDLVRSARQQDFLRQAKDQIGLGRLFGDRKELLRIFGRYTDTDLHSNSAILRLLKLAFESSGHPIREVRFRGDIGPEFVTISPQQPRAHQAGVPARQGVDRARASSARAKKLTRKAQKRGATHLARPADRRHRRQDRRREPRRAGRDASSSFPLYYPQARLARGGYSTDGSPRLYDIYDTHHRRYKAYRLVVSAGARRPVLRRAGDDLEVAADPRRRLQHDADARAHLQAVLRRHPAAPGRPGARRTPSTGSPIPSPRRLTNRQMLAIARSLSRFGGK